MKIRNDKKIVVEGTTYSSQKKAAEFYGLDHITVWYRLKTDRTIQEAFGRKDFDYSTKPKKLKINGNNFNSLVEAGRHYGVNKDLLNSRVNR
jgi:hypothetical protein